MTYCEVCDKETGSVENRYKDVVQSEDGEYHDVYVSSCQECGSHKFNESSVG